MSIGCWEDDTEWGSQDVSLKGIYMVVMLLFCSTKMAAISLGDCNFGV